MVSKEDMAATVQELVDYHDAEYDPESGEVLIEILCGEWVDVAPAVREGKDATQCLDWARDVAWETK